MFEELNAHRQAVQENIRKAFEVGFTGNEYLEKAYQVGDEATDKHGVTYYVHALNAAGKPLWRKKKDSGANANNSSLTEQEKKEKSFLESSVRSGHRLSQRDANRLYALQRKERQAATTADKPDTLKDKKKSAKVDVPYEKLKTINETIAYAKTLSDFTFKLEKSDNVNDRGKKFSLTNKNGLKLTVVFVNDSEYVYNFKDKYGRILYHNPYQYDNSRTNWKEFFDTKTWSRRRMSEWKGYFSKYEKASSSAKMRYDRTGKAVDYQTYIDNKNWAQNASDTLEKIKKIYELS